MEEEKDKFSVISEIYSQFSEENKEKLVRTAKNLLKVQKEDTAMVADADIPKDDKGIV
jgi:hypothetical protein